MEKPKPLMCRLGVHSWVPETSAVARDGNDQAPPEMERCEKCGEVREYINSWV